MSNNMLASDLFLYVAILFWLFSLVSYLLHREHDFNLGIICFGFFILVSCVFASLG